MKTAIKPLFLIIMVLAAGLAPAAKAQMLAQDLAVAAVGAAGTSQAVAQGRAVEQQAQIVNKARTAAPQHAVQPVPMGAAPLVPPGTAPHIEEPSLGGADDSFEISPPKAAGPPKLGAGKKQDMAGPKVPDSVNNVIKRLNTATDNVTLEDLNSAREAVAKLDILIDIEKRLSDLDTLRGEREDKKLSAAIPASALGMRGGSMPPPSVAPIAPVQASPAPAAMAAPVFSPPPPEIVVERITGAGGRYVALIKSGEGKAAMMREGDKTPDGSVVTSITSRGVTLEKNKSSRTVQVKDVTVVFNGR